MKKTWITVWIQCLLLPVAECGVHSLQFLSTARVDPGVRPQFEQLTLCDGVPISYCDSDTKKEQPRPALESGPVAHSCDEGHYNMLEAIVDITRLFSSSAEVVQRRRGCLLSTNGTLSSFESWAVDGEDFIQFDADSQTWTPLSASAKKLQQRWNKKKEQNHVFSIFIKKRCPKVMSKVQLKVTEQKTVGMKEPVRPQSVDPALMQQFTEMDQRGVAPHRRSIIGLLTWEMVTGRERYQRAACCSAADHQEALEGSFNLQMKKTWVTVWIQCLLLPVAECGVHSLQFLSTARVDPGVQPQFEQLTLCDGVPISYCDSDTKKEQPRPALESGPVAPTCDDGYYELLGSLHDITLVSNGSAEVVQRRRGCLLSTNGTLSSFESWAVDGEDFIQFDADSQTWTPLSASAKKLQQLWNNRKEQNHFYSIFIRKQCPEMMSKVRLKVTEQKTEMRVFGKATGSRREALLRCHVTSTDQSVSSLQLVGGVALWSSVSRSKPSEDGCVVLRLTAGISLSQDGYGCRVETGSGNITVLWDGKTLDGTDLRPFTLPWIIAFVGIVIAIGVTSFVVIFLLKCVKMKEPPPPQSVDPALMQQFIEEDQREVDPDPRSITGLLTQKVLTDREWYH
ncbi:uncharacterized protein V6R79_021844 [Siganus canaliculatus]